MIDAGETAAVKLVIFNTCLMNGKTEILGKRNRYFDTHTGETKYLNKKLPIYKLRICYLQTIHPSHLTGISSTLDSNQSRELTGFSSGFTTTDYIHTLTK